MTVYDWSKVSRETLERVLRLAHEWSADDDSDGSEIERAVAAARTEALVPPLRTRAEVDAEIVTVLRKSVGEGRSRDCFPLVLDGSPPMRVAERLIELCAEPLAPEPDPLHPTGRCTCGGEGRCEWCLVMCADCSFQRSECQCEPPGPDECARGGDCIESIIRPGHCAKCEREMPRRVREEEEPEACSCEESERLKARIAELEDKGYRATALLIDAQQAASKAAADRDHYKGIWQVECDRTVRALKHQEIAETEARALREKIGRALQVLTNVQPWTQRLENVLEALRA